MKIKTFNGYEYPYPKSWDRMAFGEVEDRINDFIKDKNVLDIKVSGAQCEKGWEMFQYVVLYEDAEEQSI